MVADKIRQLCFYRTQQYAPRDKRSHGQTESFDSILFVYCKNGNRVNVFYAFINRLRVCQLTSKSESGQLNFAQKGNFSIEFDCERNELWKLAKSHDEFECRKKRVTSADLNVINGIKVLLHKKTASAPTR